MSINLNDNIKVNAAKSVDDRYLNNLTPWADITTANSNIPAARRHQGLTVNIAGVEYWYKDGILDNNLVLKTTETTNLFPVEVTGNQTVQESWNNRDIYFIGSGLLTYPNSGLSVGHNFNLCADFGVTITWAIASPKTWRVAGLPVGTPPPSVAAGQFCTVQARIGTNEIRVLGL